MQLELGCGVKVIISWNHDENQLLVLWISKEYN